MIEQLHQGNLTFESLHELAVHSAQQQRIASEIEEVVVPADLIDVEHFPPDLGDNSHALPTTHARRNFVCSAALLDKPSFKVAEDRSSIEFQITRQKSVIARKLVRCDDELCDPAGRSQLLIHLLDVFADDCFNLIAPRRRYRDQRHEVRHIVAKHDRTVDLGASIYQGFQSFRMSLESLCGDDDLFLTSSEI